jgi:hypothetical protein
MSAEALDNPQAFSHLSVIFEKAMELATEKVCDLITVLVDAPH